MIFDVVIVYVLTLQWVLLASAAKTSEQDSGDTLPDAATIGNYANSGNRSPMQDTRLQRHS